MTGRLRKPLVTFAALLLVLGLGGAAGWWLAMRSMPMGDVHPVGSGRNGTQGSKGMGTAPDMQGMRGMQPAAGQREPSLQAMPGTVRIDPVRLQRTGVRYAVAVREPLVRTVRAEGTVTYDEERRAAVTTKVAGWIERLYVDKPGQPVRRGQPLLEIYSPELVSTARELVLALEYADRAPGEPAPDASRETALRDAATAALSPSRLVESA
ncbi:MAG: efflux RND transporter periplasmic adaptor subunit, partial [Gemmatimonadetes bacterium]|nr:efflux RND transporter periplasmic adaptor subunit [Gemmatimonadota bacterium]